MPRSVKELRDRGYRFPRLSAAVESKPLIATLAVAGVLAVSATGYATAQSVHRLEHPVAAPLPYRVVDPQKTPAYQWASSLIAQSPTGESGWETSNDFSPRQPLDYDECPTLGRTSDTQVATYSAKSKHTQTFIQLYEPGTSVQAFSDYSDKLAKCFTTSQATTGNPATTVVKFPNGTMFSYGDAIVFVTTDTPANLTKLTDWYVKQTAQTLTTSHCVQVAPDQDGAQRNPFQLSKQYKGWFVSSKVVTKVNTTTFPAVGVPTTGEATPLDQPEGPLPKGFPVMPSQPFGTTPTAPIDNTSPIGPFVKSVQYQKNDVDGPGCGWAWSGMKAPIVNNAALLSAQQKLLSTTQQDVDSNAQHFVDDKLKVSGNTLVVASQVDQWNAYIAQVQKVDEKWQWLDDQRTELKPAWDEYVSEHNDWMNFDNLKANAVKDHDARVTACNQQNAELQQWEKTYLPILNQQPAEPVLPTSPSGTPTDVSSSNPTPSASDSPTIDPTVSETPSATAPTPTVSVPPRPTGCTVDVTPDPIVSKDKPAEPAAPKIPAGVTIPDSWQKPITSPSVALQ